MFDRIWCFLFGHEMTFVGHYIVETNGEEDYTTLTWRCNKCLHIVNEPLSNMEIDEVVDQ